MASSSWYDHCQPSRCTSTCGADSVGSCQLGCALLPRGGDWWLSQPCLSLLCQSRQPCHQLLCQESSRQPCLGALLAIILPCVASAVLMPSAWGLTSGPVLTVRHIASSHRDPKIRRRRRCCAGLRCHWHLRGCSALTSCRRCWYWHKPNGLRCIWEAPKCGENAHLQCLWNLQWRWYCHGDGGRLRCRARCSHGN